MISHAMFNEKIGKNIKRYVTKNRTNRVILAEKIGITPYTLSQYENGKKYICINTLERICNCLDIPFSYLLFDKREEIKNDKCFLHIDALFSEIAHTPQTSNNSLYAILELAYALY